MFGMLSFLGEKIDLFALISPLPFVDLLTPAFFTHGSKELVIFALPVLNIWYPIMRPLVSSIVLAISVLCFSLIYRIYSSSNYSFVLFILMLSA